MPATSCRRRRAARARRAPRPRRTASRARSRAGSRSPGTCALTSVADRVAVGAQPVLDATCRQLELGAAAEQDDRAAEDAGPRSSASISSKIRSASSSRPASMAPTASTALSWATSSCGAERLQHGDRVARVDHRIVEVADLHGQAGELCPDQGRGPGPVGAVGPGQGVQTALLRQPDVALVLVELAEPLQRGLRDASVVVVAQRLEGVQPLVADAAASREQDSGGDLGAGASGRPGRAPRAGRRPADDGVGEDHRVERDGDQGRAERVLELGLDRGRDDDVLDVGGDVDDLEVAALDRPEVGEAGDQHDDARRRRGRAGSGAAGRRGCPPRRGSRAIVVDLVRPEEPPSRASREVEAPVTQPGDRLGVVAGVDQLHLAELAHRLQQPVAQLAAPSTTVTSDWSTRLDNGPSASRRSPPRRRRARTRRGRPRAGAARCAPPRRAGSSSSR